MAHSFVMAFPDESEAFRAYHAVFPDSTVALLDTYDTLGAARRLADLRVPVKAVRLDSGDVYARALARRLEIERSLAFLVALMTHLPRGPVRVEVPPAAPGALAVAMSEGWRGETLHLLATDADGGIAFAKVVDPSFHDWNGLAIAMRGQEISDFPLCNKSFNLSYAGHDL
jgi:Ni,Fe-hydrogenase III large subunit